MRLWRSEISDLIDSWVSRMTQWSCFGPISECVGGIGRGEQGAGLGIGNPENYEIRLFGGWAGIEVGDRRFDGLEVGSLL